MESRLPKPKFNVPSTVKSVINSIKEVKTDMDTNKELKDKNNQPQKSSSETLKKCKSTMNITDKCATENKAPSKQTLTRSKTMSSINTRAVKRPATTSTVHGDVKKPYVRPVAKVTTTSTRTGTTLTNTAKPSQTTRVGKTQNSGAPVKPMKWDLKGRLAQASDELSNVRQQFKETASKCSELEEQLNSLKTTESTYKKKAEEYETLNEKLDKDLKEMKEEMNKVHKENESLTKQLKESEETVQNVSSILDQFKQKCRSQETLISKHEAVVKDLQLNLDTQMKINEDLEKLKTDLQTLVHTMDKDRRVLHNAIQEMKGNIRVFCRVRPRTNEELGKPMCTLNFIDECTIEVGKFDSSSAASGKYRANRQEFSFDKVFPPTAKQEDIFEELALLVQSALEGYNVCVFAYGQTGSGKTYTMEGLPGIETEGMIPRTVLMKEFQLLGWEYRIEASFLEIYNEHIVDLLDCQPKNHDIRMADPKGHDLFVTNLQVEEIHSPEELHECLLIAQRNRAVAATQSNERSSRSHSVARIKLIGTHKTKEEVSIGNLNLVDLAGSERLKNEESVRVTETKNINKSLANLGNVILALLKKQEHIPYRNSKLTHLLMPSLGGNSKTLMLLNVSPLDECYNETLNSLRFASNVNSCKMGNAKRTRTVLQNST
ncbi:protein claret segregational-like [Ceratina calcarata]|uniref:Protein claret segregational-like n=1 Tax=Ceratina calcarata TaxID=156304 RepID=A0AAJ7S135_9HYME|nr:protein claret segregational-like [Ceratina calcarata]XP_026669402.1 protein claret segregational-like [Ceratina calcarata]